MNELSIELEDGRTHYKPRKAIRGVARWRLEPAADEPLEGLEVRLFWYTEGKGDRDVGGMVTERVPEGGNDGSYEFTFSAPRAPHSFSGTLISLIWAIELVALPSGDAARQEIVVSPTGEEIRLTSAEDEVDIGGAEALGPSW